MSKKSRDFELDMEQNKPCIFNNEVYNFLQHAELGQLNGQPSQNSLFATDGIIINNKTGYVLSSKLMLSNLLARHMIVYSKLVNYIMAKNNLFMVTPTMKQYMSNATNNLPEFIDALNITEIVDNCLLPFDYFSPEVMQQASIKVNEFKDIVNNELSNYYGIDFNLIPVITYNNDNEMDNKYYKTSNNMFPVSVMKYILSDVITVRRIINLHKT